MFLLGSVYLKIKTTKNLQNLRCFIRRFTSNCLDHYPFFRQISNPSLSFFLQILPIAKHRAVKATKAAFINSRLVPFFRSDFVKKDRIEPRIIDFSASENALLDEV